MDSVDLKLLSKAKKLPAKKVTQPYNLELKHVRPTAISFTRLPYNIFSMKLLPILP